jgi:hypothetical protein
MQKKSLISSQEQKKQKKDAPNSKKEKRERNQQTQIKAVILKTSHLMKRVVLVELQMMGMNHQMMRKGIVVTMRYLLLVKKNQMHQQEAVVIMPMIQKVMNCKKAKRDEEPQD